MNLNHRFLLDMVTSVCVFVFLLCSEDKIYILAGPHSIKSVFMNLLLRARLRDYVKVSPHKDGKTNVCICESGATLLTVQ